MGIRDKHAVPWDEIDGHAVIVADRVLSRDEHWSAASWRSVTEDLWVKVSQHDLANVESIVITRCVDRTEQGRERLIATATLLHIRGLIA